LGVAIRKKKTNQCWQNGQKERDTTKVRPLVKELFYTKFEGSTATRWGLLQEESTNTQYLKEKQYTSPDLSTSQSGLIISPDNP